MKLKDVEPGQCFTTMGEKTVFLRVGLHANSTSLIVNRDGERHYPCINLESMMITTWMSDGNREVELYTGGE